MSETREVMLRDHAHRGAMRQNLWAGIRLVLFRPVKQSDFRSHPDQLILLALFALLVAVAGGWFGVEGTPTFSEYGLLSEGTSRLLLLIAVYLIARLLGRTQGFLPFAVIVLSVDPWITALQSLVDALPAWSGPGVSIVGVLAYAVFFWYVAVWLRAARLVFHDHRGSLAVALLVFLLVLVAPAAALPYNPLWYPQYADPVLPDFNVEYVFYRQQGMVDGTVDRMQAQRPGVVDLYHVGFGSDANQQVFRREVAHVREALDRRFDTAGRSMTLVNHSDTVDELPIASTSNLALALRRIGEKMDAEEDVLLLYLTSHGSPEGYLSVDFWPLRLNQLTADGLRRMLDKSGIRWRVVVVSACYSGSFVEALRDERTVVITAAAHDRTSFGCSNENEYTYFGEAYFDQALRQTASFIDAFALAKEIVTQREQAERLEPSNPTIFVGQQSAAHLQRLERRLAQLGDADR